MRRTKPETHPNFNELEFWLIMLLLVFVMTLEIMSLVYPFNVENILYFHWGHLIIHNSWRSYVNFPSFYYLYLPWYLPSFEKWKVFRIIKPWNNHRKTKIINKVVQNLLAWQTVNVSISTVFPATRRIF